MASRALWPSTFDVDQNETLDHRRAHRKKSFHLQAPPLKRKERRKGRVFDHDNSRPEHRPCHVDLQEDLRCPPPSPTFAAPKQWLKFQKPVSLIEDEPQALNMWHRARKNRGQVSPKDILPGDKRLVFSEFTDTDSSADGQSTPRPKFSSSAGSSPDYEQLANFPYEGTVVLSPIVKDGSPSSTVMTYGTFGTLRRRSSVATSTRTPSSQSVSPAHTVILLSPRTPLTPRQLEALHTPRLASFVGEERDEAPKDIQPHAVIGRPARLTSMAPDAEPLSATLKRLGAARKSQTYKKQLSDIDDDAFSIPVSIDCAAETDWAKRLTKSAVIHKAAEQELNRSREAVDEARSLFLPQEVQFPQRALASLTARQGLNDVTPAPDAGPLFSRKQARIQSTTRGAIKLSDDCKSAAYPSGRAWSQVQRMSTNLASYIFGNNHRPRANELEVFFPTTEGGRSGEVTASDRPRSKQPGDGWGGLRPRSSWFPNLRFGPLLSPNQAGTSPIQSNALRPLQLCPDRINTEAARRIDLSEDEWVDTPATPTQAPLSASFRSAPLQQLRVRFPSYLPQPSRGRQPLEHAVSGQSSDETSATAVTYTKTSAEGRPVRITRRTSMRLRKRAIVVLVVGLVLAVVSAAVTIALVRHSHMRASSTASTSGGSSAKGIPIYQNMSRRSVPHREPSRSQRHAMVLAAVEQST